MKTKLLNQINFNAIEPMSDKQMVELNGGGVKEVAKAIWDFLTGGDINVYCPTETNHYCPRH